MEQESPDNKLEEIPSQEAPKSLKKSKKLKSEKLVEQKQHQLEPDSTSSSPKDTQGPGFEAKKKLDKDYTAVEKHLRNIPSSSLAPELIMEDMESITEKRCLRLPKQKKDSVPEDSELPPRRRRRSS